MFYFASPESLDEASVSVTPNVATAVTITIVGSASGIERKASVAPLTVSTYLLFSVGFMEDTFSQKINLLLFNFQKLFSCVILCYIPFTTINPTQGECIRSVFPLFTCFIVVENGYFKLSSTDNENPPFCCSTYLFLPTLCNCSIYSFFCLNRHHRDILAWVNHFNRVDE